MLREETEIARSFKIRFPRKETLAKNYLIKHPDFIAPFLFDFFTTKLNMYDLPYLVDLTERDNDICYK